MNIVRKLRIMQILAAVVLFVAIANQVRLARVLLVGEDAFAPVVVIAFVQVCILVGLAYERVRWTGQRVQDVRYEQVAESLGLRSRRVP